MPLPMLA